MLRIIKLIIDKFKKKQKQELSEFKPISLALVRRTSPELFSNKIVGVQSMSTPVSLAYALRVFYDEVSRITFNKVRIESNISLVEWIKYYKNKIKSYCNKFYIKIQTYRKNNEYLRYTKKLGKNIEKHLNKKGMTATKRKRP